MTQSKHTPGPWLHAHREQPDGMYSTQVFTEDGETVATIAWYPKDNGFGVTSTYREANARLIAAAPDLLEALQMIVQLNPQLPMGCIEDAEAAIAKATGA